MPCFHQKIIQNQKKLQLSDFHPQWIKPESRLIKCSNIPSQGSIIWGDQGHGHTQHSKENTEKKYLSPFYDGHRRKSKEEIALIIAQNQRSSKNQEKAVDKDAEDKEIDDENGDYDNRMWESNSGNECETNSNVELHSRDDKLEFQRILKLVELTRDELIAVEVQLEGALKVARNISSYKEYEEMYAIATSFNYIEHRIDRNEKDVYIVQVDMLDKYYPLHKAAVEQMELSSKDETKFDKLTRRIDETLPKSISLKMNTLRKVLDKRKGVCANADKGEAAVEKVKNSRPSYGYNIKYSLNGEDRARKNIVSLSVLNREFNPYVFLPNVDDSIKRDIEKRFNCVNITEKEAEDVINAFLGGSDFQKK
jgi:hypothetical protein